jgi:hypothetical protein
MATLLGQFDDAPEPIQELTEAVKSLGSGVTVLPSPSSLPKSTPVAVAQNSPQKSAPSKKGARASTKVIVENEEWDEEEEVEFRSEDDLEAEMLGEKTHGGGQGQWSSLEQNLASGKMNFSQKASNEMTGACCSACHCAYANT